MVYGVPMRGIRACWYCSGCYSRLARINTFASVFIVAIIIIIACVMALRETPLHDLRQHRSPQDPAHPSD